MAKKSSGGTPATTALLAADIDFTEIPYTHHDHSTDFGDEAVRETGADPERVFKTLIVATTPGQLAVAVVPVSGHLDLKAMAQACGVKRVELAPVAVAQRSSGYVVGGVSPIGQRTPLPTVIDTSAANHDTILVSGGRRGLQIAIAPDDLVRITDATVAPIGR